jgi:hypothetical protein
MKFEMFRKEESDRGVYCTFTNGSGRSRTTYFNNPPASISHVDLEYLQGRLANVVRQEQMEFIKRRYSEEIGKFRSQPASAAFE